MCIKDENKVKIENFIDIFVKEIKNENAGIFAGAGLSCSSGFVAWKELLKPLAEEIGLDIEREADLIDVAQYYKNETNNRYRINERISEAFRVNTGISENHKILARLPIKTYWTTNYDSLIEDSLEYMGKLVDKKYTVEQLVITKSKYDAVIYKMHGDKEHSSQAIILKEDYELYNKKYEPFITALRGDLARKTFLFIGFSFLDPNLKNILNNVKASYNHNQHTHYTFLKKESDTYKAKKQELFINDLKRYNIQVLLISDYSEITDRTKGYS